MASYVLNLTSLELLVWIKFFGGEKAAKNRSGWELARKEQFLSWIINSFKLFLPCQAYYLIWSS